MMILDFIKRKPFYLFLVIGLFFLTLSFSKAGDSTFDINVHDTYFVVAHSHLFKFYFFIFFLLFGFYWLFWNGNLQKNNLFEKTYVYGTLILFLLFNYWGWFLSLFQNSNEIYDSSLIYGNIIILISFILFVLLQIIWIIYMLVLFVKRLLGKSL